jgi:hypothetical protein
LSKTIFVRKTKHKMPNAKKRSQNTVTIFGQKQVPKSGCRTGP